MYIHRVLRIDGVTAAERSCDGDRSLPTFEENNFVTLPNTCFRELQSPQLIASKGIGTCLINYKIGFMSIQNFRHVLSDARQIIIIGGQVV